jgi:hypothetical protein
VVFSSSLDDDALGWMGSREISFYLGPFTSRMGLVTGPFTSRMGLVTEQRGRVKSVDIDHSNEACMGND